MTIAADTSGGAVAPATNPTRRPGSLTSPAIRHVLVFIAAAALAYYLGTRFAIAEQTTLWLAATGVLGLAAGLISRGWLGLLFLLVGLFVGRLVELQLRFGAGPLPAEELTGDGPLYLAALGTAVAGYVVVVLLLTVVRRRR